MFQFHHHSHISTPVVATNKPIHPWCHEARTQSARLVERIELCTAVAMGDDGFGMPVEKIHLHTLVRVFLAPAADSDASVLLIERVLSTLGAHHSVTPIPEELPNGGSLFHPEVHDRVCVVSEGPSETLSHHVEVERTLTFGDGFSSSEPRLTLGELAQILEFVSRSTKLACAGGDCKYQSRSFAFACLAALTPTLPPCTLVKRDGGERVDMNASQHGSTAVSDSVFALAAVKYLEQVPWLFRDPDSVQALRMIASIKDQPRAGDSFTHVRN